MGKWGTEGIMGGEIAPGPTGDKWTGRAADYCQEIIGKYQVEA